MTNEETTVTMSLPDREPGRSAGRPPGALGRLVALVGAMLAVLAAAIPATASAITLTDATVEPVANARTPDVTVAGAHPDMRVNVRVEQDPVSLAPVEELNTLNVDLPPGVVANPQAAAICSGAQFMSDDCPAASQVGTGITWLNFPGMEIPMPSKIYNLPPGPDAPARMGLLAGPAALGRIVVEVTPEGDYAIKTSSPEIARTFAIVGLDLTFWGIPGDNNGSGDAKPYMSNPTQCATQPEAVVAANGYGNPTFDVKRVAWPLMTGCDSLPFDPSVNVTPVERVAGGATKVDVDVMVEQNEDPDGQSAATLKRAVVNLPEGVSINPGMARDLSACTDGAFGLKSAKVPECSAGSKIGTAGLVTPLLVDPLPGDIFVGQPLPGNAYRVFVHLAGKGTRIKLEGEIRPDPKTGRLSAIFDNNPQLPFSWLRLSFRGGNKAVLAMPATCGPKATQAGFDSWAGQSVQRSSVFQVYADTQGSPCAEQQPFDPMFQAGTTSTNPGGDTGMVVAFGREDAERALGAIDVRMPPGLLGRLSAIPFCPSARAAAGTCGDESLVGGARVSTGAGGSLLNLAGKVFLTEPPKGGQVAGLSIVTPAVAGPYDLGTVVVRAGITVNPDTSLRVESDPLPTVLQGIPLRIRRVVLTLDRPGFMLNPSDCSPKRIAATITSSEGAAVEREVPFGVRGCGSLGFEPEMQIAATRPDRDKRMGLSVALTVPDGQANMREVNLTLPSGFGARLDGPLQTPCAPEDFAADRCAASAKVGTSKAVTPVLPTPLAGDVFFIANPDGLPHLGIRLKGMVTIDVIGHVTVLPNGRVNATFPAIPDVPISEFSLELAGGDGAVLAGNADVCDGLKTAALQIIAHSGRVSRQFVPATIAGCGKRR